MLKFLAGVFVGLVVATFAPKVADLSRDLFDAGRNLGGEVVETVGEATDE
jgi:hypothetical protein